MADSPHISVVLTVFNHALYLEDCLHSVLEQSYSNFEFVIVDDGSTDGSSEILEKVASRYPERIRLSRLEVNRGQGHALNVGIEMARGELIALLDSDDIWFADKLQRVANAFGDASSVALFQHNLLLLKDGSLSDERFCVSIALGDLAAAFGESGDLQSLASMAPTSGLVFSARALREIGPIPESFQICADGYLRRAAVHFGRVEGMDTCLGAYRVHEANATVGNNRFDPDAFSSELLRPALNALFERQGIDVRLSEFGGKFSLVPLCLRAGDRVLLARTAPPSRMVEIISEIRRSCSGVFIDLMAQDSIRAALEPHVDRWLSLEEGMMSEKSFGDETKQALRTSAYACALAPYMDADGARYGNVHGALMALDLGCPVLGIGISGNLIEVASSAGRSDSLTPSSRSALRSLSALRNTHKGARAFIVGNGPSLEMDDLEKLGDEITFGSNKIFLAFDQVKWRPTYYSVCDHMVASNNSHRIRSLELDMLMPKSVMPFGCANERTLWYQEQARNEPMSRCPEADLGDAFVHFSRDAAFGIEGGYTIIYHQLQWAYHMGIREVYLIGVDFSFEVPEEKVADLKLGQGAYSEALVSRGERNHFHPDYRVPGEHWTMPRLDLQARCFARARQVFESSGGLLANASRQTKLTALPRVSFDDLRF